MSSHREVITLQSGPCSNLIGAYFWGFDAAEEQPESLSNTAHIQRSAQAAKNYQSYQQHYFAVDSHNSNTYCNYHPRVISLDYGKNTLAKQSLSLHKPLDRETLDSIPEVAWAQAQPAADLASVNVDLTSASTYDYLVHQRSQHDSYLSKTVVPIWQDLFPLDDSPSGCFHEIKACFRPPTEISYLTAMKDFSGCNSIEDMAGATARIQLERCENLDAVQGFCDSGGDNYGFLAAKMLEYFREEQGKVGMGVMEIFENLDCEKESESDRRGAKISIGQSLGRCCMYYDLLETCNTDMLVPVDISSSSGESGSSFGSLEAGLIAAAYHTATRITNDCHSSSTRSSAASTASDSKILLSEYLKMFPFKFGELHSGFGFGRPGNRGLELANLSRRGWANNLKASFANGDMDISTLPMEIEGNFNLEPDARMKLYDMAAAAANAGTTPTTGNSLQDLVNRSVFSHNDVVSVASLGLSEKENMDLFRTFRPKVHPKLQLLGETSMFMPRGASDISGVVRTWSTNESMNSNSTNTVTSRLNSSYKDFRIQTLMKKLCQPQPELEVQREVDQRTENFGFLDTVNRLLRGDPAVVEGFGLERDNVKEMIEFLEGYRE